MRCGASVAAHEVGQDLEDLEVDPDDVRHDREGAQPRVLHGHAGVDADLDGVEVAHEAQHSDEDGENADDDAERNTEDSDAVDGPHVHHAGDPTAQR